MSEVTLTEVERVTLAEAFTQSSRSPAHLAFLVAPAVESILTARLAGGHSGCTPALYEKAMSEVVTRADIAEQQLVAVRASITALAGKWEDEGVYPQGIVATEDLCARELRALLDTTNS